MTGQAGGSPGAVWGPNVFVVGAQKAGTTRFCNLLQRHPLVTFPTKEPFYFQTERDVMDKEQWYRDLFATAAGVPLRGDGSTYYSMAGIYPGTAKRIAEFNPEARIIYLVRDPLRRIESAWRHLLSVGDANSFIGFERTLYETPLLIDPTLYWAQLSEYRSYFPDDQIKVLFFEEFVADELSQVRSALKFLGVDPTVEIQTGDDQARNSSEGARQRLAVVDAARALPGYASAKRFIPQSLKTLFTDRVNRPVPAAPVWTETSRRWALERLGDDPARLLGYCGQDASIWTMI